MATAYRFARDLSCRVVPRVELTVNNKGGGDFYAFYRPDSGP